MIGTDPDIFELALVCYRNPLAHQGRLASTAPLPDGMNRLLWLANGSPEVLEAAARQTGAKAEELREAGRFLVQQLCFARGASHYRVLGLEPGATSEQIKEHHRLLIRLFHPDRSAGRANWTDHYASRVNESWSVLSRPQTRVDYDERLRRPPAPVLEASAVRASEPGTPPGRIGRRRRRKLVRSRPRHATLRRWWPVLVLGGLALVAVLLVGGIHLFGPQAAPAVFASVEPAIASPPVVPAASVNAEPADHSAIAALLIAPDWQALGRREQQARQRMAPAPSTPEPPEPVQPNRLATAEELLEQMQAERIRLEERLRAEQARSEQIWAEQLAAERARLERRQAEQLAAERVRLERRQAERVRAEQFVARLREEQRQSGRVPAEPDPPAPKSQEPRVDRQRGEEREWPERSTTGLPAASSVALSPALDGDALTASELSDLLDRYTSAYQQGDLDRLMALFAPGARGKEGNDRARIERDYAALFGMHLIQRLRFHDLRWSRQGPSSARATARYELWLRRRDGDSLSQLAGSIRFEMYKRNGRVLIESIDYDWLGR
jgi:curved DNA-binding protein CbpA